jgi:HEAT repeat protein
MRRFRLLLCVAAIALAPSFARGHGGTFRGPNSGVPPNLREPSDPEPPPPPPSDPGTPGGPTTGDGDPPSTPTPGTGPGTADQPPAPPAPSPGPGGPGPGRGSRTRSSLGYDNWRFWWAYNNDDILNFRAAGSGTRTISDVFFGRGDESNRRDAMRPTQREIAKTVVPALLRCIDRADEHEDVHGGAIISVSKLGTAKLIPLLEAIVWNRRVNDRGERIDYGPQARESAVLALGLIPEMDDAACAEARRILLAAVADDALRTRERTWAAVALGLRRDRDAVAPLLDLLPRRYPDDNVPAGIVVGLGLIGDPLTRGDLEEIFTLGKLGGRDLPARVRPFAGYALGKLGDPQALPAVLSVLGSRRAGALAQRSAALAAGALGEVAGPADKAAAVDALLRTLRRSSADGTTQSFALVSLGRIGTEPALHALLEAAENGSYAQRPFAALGLGTHVFYVDRAAAQGGGAPLDATLRRRIVDKLARLGERLKDADTRAAFLLARGLVKDRDATEELVSVVSRPGDEMLRGFACVSLGLLGRARDDVKDAIRRALAERRSVDLRRQAATALGLLRDAGTVPHLLDDLRDASSFVVQGQIVAALGAIGDQRALAPLVTLLEDRGQSTTVRAMAAVGLGLIGDPRPLPPLARLSRDYNYRASVPDLDELLYIF